MNELTLVLTGAAISLVTSAVVTWLLGRQARQTQDRSAVRDSARRLTAVFIAERDASTAGTEAGSPSRLAEAEAVSLALTDRKVRGRIGDVIRLLRESGITELQELSGVRSGRGRSLLCDHALDVLGAHFRGERLPALPEAIRKMLDVENEALGIHSGSTLSSPVVPSGSPVASAEEEPAPAPAVSSRKVRSKPRPGAPRSAGSQD
ncbi:hypothetical protein [Nocardiopsis ansamitocini]|uniref:Uncharacterized protein n=1 Tax=Nocardiopsis ansamitocini TaxID=1670832 RepID=A0A9W6P3M8_9ACTN|nr:hypothetical protein [Nocardiopsis ansamitocini]GLU46513.1 hypothetical protein Nans01_08640 [Nocardiopsis ansamitocini]